jgi:copper homeostasis protein
MCTFEICANSVESCLAAQEGGAQRVELCASIPEGGTTPSLGEIAMARKLLSIQLHVIIRPRGGDFCYTSCEVDTMIADIAFAREAGINGVVFGCLTPYGEVDLSAMQRLMEASKGLNVTFHRAFDHCFNPIRSMEEIIYLGCQRILTSGQEATAEEGIPLLKELHEKADGRIQIMAGCGVNEKNIAKIQAATGIEEFHFSAREKKNSPMRYRNRKAYMGDDNVDEYLREITTAQRVSATIASLTHR